MIDPARWRALDAAVREPLEADKAELEVLNRQFSEWCCHVKQVWKDLNNDIAGNCLADVLLAMDTAQVDGISAAISAVDMAIGDLGLGPDEHQHALGLGRVG